MKYLVAFVKLGLAACHTGIRRRRSGADRKGAVPSAGVQHGLITMLRSICRLIAHRIPHPHR